ncbi:MAG: hypothetical protein LUG89_05800 [Methanosphaera sp.]|nr:hypothetical protein [Methanosphaera sp.]
MKPYVILIGSASGIGKSTIASQLSTKLGIKYLIETDFIREVVRGIIGSDYAPALHKSSYDAYTVLRDQYQFDTEEKLIDAGFEEHASFVVPAIEKVIQRSVKDKDSIIIEGVHLIPGLINIEQFKDLAEVYFFILTTDEEVHKQRFIQRAMTIKRGGAQLDYFKENRMINDHLVNMAKMMDIPVIDNSDKDKTTATILQYINEVSRVIYLKHSLDDIDLEHKIITQLGGRITDISYYLEDSDEPLTRQIRNYDDEKYVNEFFDKLDNSNDEKETLETLYRLSDNIHSHTLYAPDENTLEEIIDKLRENGLIYDNITT